MLALALAAVAVAAAQQTDWRRIGSPSVDLMLASPATGPVQEVWFSPEGSLFARTRSGRIFQTQDFQTWTPAAAVPSTAVASASAFRQPEPGARVVSPSTDPSILYSLGTHLFRSEDGGRTWANLTAYHTASVVGPGQHSVAVSPNPDQIVVANDFGVWRTVDAGLSWSGLNQGLPNLAVRRILSTPSGAVGTRIQVDGLGVLELPPGGSVWQPAPAAANMNEQLLRQKFSAVAHADVTAFAVAENTVYAGTGDGRVFVSVDGGATFPSSQTVGGPVERIYSDPAAPLVALAALSGNGPHVVRTFNGGNFWDPLDGNLPSATAHAIAADRAAGAIYVATDRGVFYAHVDLAGAAAGVNWTSLSDGLPAVPAMDVRLDPTGVQLYAALDGYGVFATAAPHRLTNLRVVNAADYSARAAAPGSLLSVIGGRVNAARGGNLTYPVLAASDSESQIQVPFDATGPNVSLELDTARGRFTRPVPVLPVSPAILVGRDGAPMLWDADSGMPLDSGNTAHPYARVQIWATGLGKVRPDWPTGMAAPMKDPPAVIANVRAFLDRTPVQVTRATLVPGYVGFYLIEVQLPSIANAGTAELYISADGQESNRVQLVIER
ncbi:MAG TPA: hypothetical protein VGF59_27625 [Bryobacteraceae bacterium]